MNDPDTTSGATKRPRLLTALCILSFLGCGVMLVGIMGYSAYKAQAASIVRLEGLINGSGALEGSSAAGDADGMGTLEEELANLNTMATNSLTIGLLSVLVCVGVLLMWWLKRAGFYVYTLGQLATLATPFLLVGSITGVLMTLLLAIFPILFIILYGLNLKHMS